MGFFVRFTKAGHVSQRQKGFTLPELLLALALIGVVAGSIFFHFYTGLFIYTKVDAAMGTLKEMRLCFAKMDTELHTMVPLPDADIIFDTQKISFPAVVDIYEKGTIIPTLKQVTYEYKNNAVYRSVAPLEGTGDNERKKTDIVLGGITGFSFVYPGETPQHGLIWKNEKWDDLVVQSTDVPAPTESIPVPEALTMRFQVKKTAAQATDEPIKKTFFIPIGILPEVKLGA